MILAVLLIICVAAYVYSLSSTHVVVPWVKPAQTDSLFFEKNGKIYLKNESLGSTDELEDADAATFVVPDASVAVTALALTYAKDKNHVYYRTVIDGTAWPIKYADPATFELITGSSDYDAQDKNHKYFLSWIACE